MLLPLCVVLFSGSLFFSGSDLAYASTQSHQVRTFWVQVMDSCRQALPGAFFSYKVNGTTVHEGPTPGLKPLTVSVGIPCPVQRGNCVRSTTGCLAFTIPVPASGTKTYTIKETKSPHGYMPCTGGSVCPGGPQIITLHINASGAISATVLNVNPNRVPVIWPTQGKPYRGTASDPAVLHNFGIGNGNCDGDDDADDRLTGTPSIYCDSDND
ncbi:MAG TPA: hypothetical protein VH593_12635 [Ktedonobacteraceae bacterium]|jgi:hypothetical protein